MTAIALARTGGFRPNDRLLLGVLFGVSGAGSLGALGLLLAGDPGQAARAFCGAVLLNTLLILAAL